jgi:hypothetical protein
VGRGANPWRIAFSTSSCITNAGTHAERSASGTSRSTVSHSKRSTSISRYASTSRSSFSRVVSSLCVTESDARRNEESAAIAVSAFAGSECTRLAIELSALNRKCGFS